MNANCSDQDRRRKGIFSRTDPRVTMETTGLIALHGTRIAPQSTAFFICTQSTHSISLIDSRGLNQTGCTENDGCFYLEHQTARAAKGCASVTLFASPRAFPRALSPSYSERSRESKDAQDRQEKSGAKKAPASFCTEAISRADRLLQPSGPFYPYGY